MMIYISGWKEHGGKPGITLVDQDPATGVLARRKTMFEDLSCNCTALDWERNILYITNELHENPDFPKGGGGLLYAFTIHPDTGDLTQLSRVYSCCPCPAYLSLNQERTHLLCANHSSFGAATKAKRNEDGTWGMEVIYDDAFVGVFRLNEDGSIGPLVDVHQHNAFPVPPRALHSRPHTVVMSPDGTLFACCDKGDAHIYMYRLEGDRLTLASQPFADEPGTSPRYCAFHPTLPYLYINHEKGTVLRGFRYSADGVLTPVGDADALPDNAPRGVETAAVREFLHGVETKWDTSGFMPLEQQGLAIHPSGKYIYDMLNGADAVGVFAVDPQTGTPRRIQTVPVDGRWVRGCAVSPDGRWLVVTCLQAGGVYCFAIENDGTLTPSSHVDVEGGSYVTFYR